LISALDELKYYLGKAFYQIQLAANALSLMKVKIWVYMNIFS